MPKDKHSPEGKLYRQLGDKELTKHYKRKRRLKRLSTRVSALGKATSHTKGSTVKPSGPLSYGDWTKKYGYGKTATTMKRHRQYKKNFGK